MINTVNGMKINDEEMVAIVGGNNGDTDYERKTGESLYNGDETVYVYTNGLHIGLFSKKATIRIIFHDNDGTPYYYVVPTDGSKPMTVYADDIAR